MLIILANQIELLTLNIHGTVAGRNWAAEVNNKIVLVNNR